MREAMLDAPVGDEQKGEDPTTAALEARVADMLGKEAAVFLPSGTLCNEIALRVWLKPGETLIGDRACHIITSEGGALTFQVLHASDFEAGIAALDDAPRFSSVLNALKSAYPSATLVLASGDNYIPGPFFTASADPAAPFNGIKGRADITILNALGINASCFGNGLFDPSK